MVIETGNYYKILFLNDEYTLDRVATLTTSAEVSNLSRADREKS